MRVRVRIRVSLQSRDKIIKLVMVICQTLLITLLLLLFVKIYNDIFVFSEEFSGIINHLIQVLIYASPFLIALIELISKYEGLASNHTKSQCAGLPRERKSASIRILKLNLFSTFLIGVLGSFLLWLHLNQKFFYILGISYHIRAPETFGLSLIGVIVVFVSLLLCNLVLSYETQYDRNVRNSNHEAS